MRLLLCLTLAILSHGAIANNEWVESPHIRTLPGEASDGKVYFGTQFTQQKGNYKATYESVMESRDSLSGNFLIGSFRYVFNHPNPKSFLAPKHDEMITQVVLECSQHFSGTVAVLYKLKDKVVKNDVKPASEVTLYQDSNPSTVNDLCAYAKSKKMW